jgi:ATP-binding protein involved in chromosome partitioning
MYDGDCAYPMVPMPLPPVPYAITREPGGVRIDWDDAGHSWLYQARPLRLACPCAGCVEEMTGRLLLNPTSVPMDVHPESLALVGSYGLRIRWSDGHDTGIYTFEQLLGLCGCPRCRAV